MRGIEKTVFLFSELSDSAKEKARQWGREVVGQDMAWSEESKASIEAFCAEFRVTLNDWSVGAYSPFHFSTNAENHNYRGRKLSEFNRDNMPTGYWLDCSLWMTFFDEFKRTGSAKTAFDAAMNEGFKEWRNDLEDQLSNEQIDEFLTANEYEFEESGHRY